MKKLTEEEINKVIILQSEMMNEHPKWRTGQALFNALYALFPEIGDSVRGGSVDPFHIDGNIGKCLEFISE